jgi:lipopolysaccharide transport system ATP-binding protein
MRAAMHSIQVEKLSKKVPLRHSDGAAYRTLREEVMHSLSYPLRWLKGERTLDEDFWPLRDIDFSARKGEIVGIIGRNGAGKSTLLKILSRVTPPTSGRARLRGRIGSLLEVGTGFHPELTGRENILLSGAMLGMKRAEIMRKFDAIVAFAEVERFLDLPVKRYSSGMYVRLGFSVAAHLEPDVLIIDEVLAVGDAAFQKNCLTRLREAAQAGTTVLLVSHNMAAVNEFCSRVLWIDEGRLRMDGEPQLVTARYLTDREGLCGSRRWTWPGDAPGDAHVRLLGVSVVQKGSTTTLVDINEPFEIEVEFQALHELTNLVTGLSFYDASMNYLFAHLDWRPNELAPGIYRKRARLPAPLLAEGRITVLVQLRFYDLEVVSAVCPDVLAFEAEDSDHPASVRGPYKDRWPGVVRVALDWTDAQPIPADSKDGTA